MWRVLRTLTVLLVSVPAGRAGGAARDRFLGYLPRPGLAALSADGLQASLDLLAETLEEKVPPFGRTTMASRLLASTLHSENNLCQKHTQIFWKELNGTSVWPALMFDATGKLPDGVLVGNVNAFGSYDECLGIEVALNGSVYPDLPPDGLSFFGRYVPVIVTSTTPSAVSEDGLDLPAAAAQQPAGGLGEIIVLPKMGMGTGIVGMCVPSSCSSQDVQSGLQDTLGGNFSVSAFESYTSHDSVEFTAGDIVVISIMAVVGYLMVVGTIVDLFHRRCIKQQATQLYMTSVVDSPNPRLSTMLHVVTPKPSKLRQRAPLAMGTKQQALVAFSVYTNIKKLMDTTPGKDTLNCLHGIRFLSMTWVVIGHACGQIFNLNQNDVVALDWFKNPLFEIVVNAMPSVDTFFLLSGLLLAYGFCNVYEKKKSFNIPMFYLHRYLRLTPPLAAMVAICATFFVYLGDGPIWSPAVRPAQASCADYWWRNLLYIQNFFNAEDCCLGQSWYLANDMQMFVFSPLALLPLVWRPLLGGIWLCVLIVGFTILRVVTWSVDDLPPIYFTLKPLPPETVDLFNRNYGYPWMRCNVWLLGLGLGYILHRLRGKRITMKPWLWLPLWIAALAIGIAVVFGMSAYQMPWEPASKAVSVAYGGLHRLAWGVAVSWVIFACVTGYGGFINMFLSYPGFIPLSRLTYAGYLIHINVLMAVDNSAKGTVYFDVVRLVYRVLAHVITSFAFALPLSLAFESPFINLERIFLGPKKKPAGVNSK